MSGNTFLGTATTPKCVYPIQKNSTQRSNQNTWAWSAHRWSQAKKWMGDVFIWAFQPKCNYNARCSIEIDTEKTVNDFTTPRPIATQSGRLRRCGAGRFTPFFFPCAWFFPLGPRGGQRIQERGCRNPQVGSDDRFPGNNLRSCVPSTLRSNVRYDVSISNDLLEWPPFHDLSDDGASAATRRIYVTAQRNEKEQKKKLGDKTGFNSVLNPTLQLHECVCTQSQVEAGKKWGECATPTSSSKLWQRQIST